MKEAAGEANMTVITIVLIAIVLGVGTIIVTNLMNNTSNKSNDVMDGTASTCPTGYNWNGSNCVKQ